MNKITNLLLTFAAACLLESCVGTKDVAYLQDMHDNVLEQAIPSKGIIIEPNDLLSIVVTTKDPELSAVFNIQPGSTSGSSVNNSESARKIDYGYRVDPSGNITFPTLGELHISGLTRGELETMIKQRILKEGLLKDFLISVSFLNFKISVMGDVSNPGNFTINDDKYTIFQALADAGDLNITGKRDGVLVVREKNGKRQVYTLDLRSKDIFNSPAYYMQQNDVVIVTPNNKKAGESDINSNSWRQVGTWMSLVTFVASMASVIIALTNNK